MADSRTTPALVITALAFFCVLSFVLIIYLSQLASRLSNAMRQADHDISMQTEEIESLTQDRDSISSALLTAENKIENQANRIKILRREREAVEYSPTARQRYRDLFYLGDEAAIRDYLIDANNSLATQASWQLVKLTIPEESGSKRYRVGQKELTEFLDFFELRNRIRVPDWWRDEISTCGAYRRSQFFAGEFTGSIYGPRDDNGAEYPKHSRIDKIDGITSYSDQNNSITIPRKFLRDGAFRDCINAAFTEELCIMAIHNCVGFSHDVICIDRASGKIVWKSKACGYATWGGTTGIHRSWLTVETTTDGRVFVFGSGNGGFYAHGFSTTDGRTLMYFASNF